MLREEVGDDIDDSFTISAFWILLCHFWHLVFYHFSGKHGLSRIYFPDYKLRVYPVWNLVWQLQTLREVTHSLLRCLEINVLDMRVYVRILRKTYSM